MKKYFSPKTIKNYLIKRKIKNINKFDIEWKNQNFNRIALVNLLLKKYENPDYLEIGCNASIIFSFISWHDTFWVSGGNIYFIKYIFYTHKSAPGFI